MCLPVITGVHQGCILSPLLFLVCIDYVMRKALNHPEFGIPWGRGKLTDLDFADDVALLSHSATTLQQMTDSLKTSAEMVVLRISSDKTKVSTVSATDTPVSIGQQISINRYPSINWSNLGGSKRVPVSGEHHLHQYGC